MSGQIESTLHSVDVLLSTYNGERYVAQAIEAILGQTYRDFTLHIVDDSSSDDTWSIITRFEDPRIVRSRNAANAGLFANLNMLVSRTHAPWIKLIGQDDILNPDCLERGLAFAREHRGLGCFWCYNDFIDGAGQVFATAPTDHVTSVLDTSEADRDCLTWGCLSSNIANLFISREALAIAGPFRCDIMSADFDIMSRIQGNYTIGRFTDNLVLVRSHSGQWSGDIRQMENHVAGNMQVFGRIFRRAVDERRSISRREATDRLGARLARNEFNWVLKALQVNRDLRAARRSLASVGGVIPLHVVAAKWAKLMMPRYLKRLLPRSQAPSANDGRQLV